MSHLKISEKHYDILHPLLVLCNSGSAITWDYSKLRIEVHDETVWIERLEANADKKIGLSSAKKSFGTEWRTAEEDDIMSILLARKKHLKEKKSSSTSSQGTKKRKLPDSQSLCDVLGWMADSLDKFLMTETQKATTEEVLRELEKVDLDCTQKLNALDMMMYDQRLFDTFSGMPNNLRPRGY